MWNEPKASMDPVKETIVYIKRRRICEWRKSSFLCKGRFSNKVRGSLGWNDMKFSVGKKHDYRMKKRSLLYMIYNVLTIPGGAGFLPSTVWSGVCFTLPENSEVTLENWWLGGRLISIGGVRIPRVGELPFESMDPAVKTPSVVMKALPVAFDLSASELDLALGPVSRAEVFQAPGWLYRFLEPKWPLFWLEKALFWGVDLQKWRSFGFQVYIVIN